MYDLCESFGPSQVRPPKSFAGSKTVFGLGAMAWKGRQLHLQVAPASLDFA